MLEDYGFWRMHGGALSWEAGTGIVAHPEHYVFTHHPYGLWWFYVALYYFFGAGGIMAVVLLLKYISASWQCITQEGKGTMVRKRNDIRMVHPLSHPSRLENWRLLSLSLS